MITTAEDSARKALRDSDLARYFGVHLSTIRNWIASGKLPEPVVIGNKRYWRPEVIDQIFSTHSTAAGSITQEHIPGP